MVSDERIGLLQTRKQCAELNIIEFCQGSGEYKSCISQRTPKANIEKQEIYPWVIEQYPNQYYWQPHIYRLAEILKQK
jgi:hypothetical protein